MKKVGVIVGLIVLVAAGVCAWAFFKNAGGGDSVVVDGARPRVQEARDTHVVVATRDIEKDALIAPDYLEDKQVPEREVPESAINSQSIAAGSFAAVPIAAGTVILAGHLKHATVLDPSKTLAKKQESGKKGKHK